MNTYFNKHMVRVDSSIAGINGILYLCKMIDNNIPNTPQRIIKNVLCSLVIKKEIEVTTI